MQKLTVIAKNTQGKTVFNKEIEGRSEATKVFKGLVAREDVKSVAMTRYQAAFGSTEIVRSYSR